MKWTTDQERKLRELYDADTPASVIATTLGRSTTAVYKRASILGLADPQRSQERAKERGVSKAYQSGREAKSLNRAKVRPHNLNPAECAWWLAGWHDKDIELGNSVLPC